jgi:hypothetical protein
MRCWSCVPILAAVALGFACGPDEANLGGEESSEDSSDGTDEQAEGPSCSFTLTGSDPQTPDDPAGCSAHTNVPDCVDAEGCRIVELAPVSCEGGDACVSPEREFIACVPFEVVCKPHSGRLLCEVDDSGFAGPAWIAFDNCEVPGFAACETTATGLDSDAESELAGC